MAIDIWNLTIPSKKSELVSIYSIDDAKESNKSGGHFVEKSNPKTSKKAAFDIWNLTNSSIKHQASSSLDVFSQKQQKRLIESSGIPSDDRKEISLGTVSSLSPPAAVPTGQGQPLSYEKRTVKERLWWMEWVLGFGPDKQQMEKVRLWWAEYGANAPDRKAPYLDCGIPMIPYSAEPKYRYWDSGQPLLSTLLELGAADKMIDERVTKERNPDDWRRWQEIKAARRT